MLRSHGSLLAWFSIGKIQLKSWPTARAKVAVPPLAAGPDYELLLVTLPVHPAASRQAAPAAVHSSRGRWGPPAGLFRRADIPRQIIAGAASVSHVGRLGAIFPPRDIRIVRPQAAAAIYLC